LFVPGRLSFTKRPLQKENVSKHSTVLSFTIGQFFMRWVEGEGDGGRGGHGSKPHLCHVTVAKLTYISSNSHKPSVFQSGTCLAQVSL